MRCGLSSNHNCWREERSLMRDTDPGSGLGHLAVVEIGGFSFGILDSEKRGPSCKNLEGNSMVNQCLFCFNLLFHSGISPVTETLTQACV